MEFRVKRMLFEQFQLRVHVALYERIKIFYRVKKLVSENQRMHLRNELQEIFRVVFI